MSPLTPTLCIGTARTAGGGAVHGCAPGGIGAEVSTWMAYWSPDAGAAAPGVMLANRVAAVGCAEPASTAGRTANAMTTPTPATAILRVRTSMQRASMAASSREHPGLSWPGPHRRTELAAGSG